MTTLIGERIKVKDFVNGLSRLQFDEVTYDKIRELFPNSYVEFVNDINVGMGFRDHDLKDISIDDYTFTIERITEPNDECSGSYFTINNSIRLGTDVEVWLPTDHQGSMDTQATGTIHFEHDYYMTIELDVD